MSNQKCYPGLNRVFLINITSHLKCFVGSFVGIEPWMSRNRLSNKVFPVSIALLCRPWLCRERFYAARHTGQWSLYADLSWFHRFCLVATHDAGQWFQFLHQRGKSLEGQRLWSIR